jgi:protein-disulfide isomerase
LLSKQIPPLNQQLRKFKYNKDLFEKMLENEVKHTLPAEEHSLIIGNREAEHVITMVSNPYCQPCAKTHKALDEWLVDNNNIKLQVIFSTSNKENDRNTQVAAHLMNLQSSQNDFSLKKALDDWYEQKQKNYEAWAKVHPNKGEIATQKIFEKQREWCKLTEITGTPTLFLNGRRLPKNYQTEDLKYFI